MEWGGAEWTMVLAAVTGGPVSPSDSPLTRVPKQMGRHSKLCWTLAWWHSLCDPGNGRNRRKGVGKSLPLHVPGEAAGIWEAD